MKISVILPTRNRLERAQRFLSSLYKTCNNPSEVEIVILTDNDDDSYKGLTSPFTSTKKICGERRGLGEITHNGIRQSTGEVIFLCNDDVAVQTRGWDDEFYKIHKRFADGIYLMSPNDLNKSKKLFVFPVFSRKLFDLLGDFPLDYKGAFIDSHIHEIFKSLEFRGLNRMIYLDHVKFQHEHFRVTGEAPDTTYRDRDRFADDWVFFTSVGKRKGSSDALLKFVQEGYHQTKLSKRKLGLTQSLVLYTNGSYIPMLSGLRIIMYFVARFIYKIVLR